MKYVTAPSKVNAGSHRRMIRGKIEINPRQKQNNLVRKLLNALAEQRKPKLQSAAILNTQLVTIK